jgi:hypothetical protein
MEEAPTLPELLWAAWSWARVLASPLGAAVLAARARRPTSWPCCPPCGAYMRRKGFGKRQVISLLGPLRWQRRVGRCPQGCETPQGAPVDDARGVHPPQRTRSALQPLGGALAVFVPCATAATLLGWARGVAISPRAGWDWVQASGRRALAQLHAQLQAVAPGHVPPEEPLAAALAAAPLLLGAEGVRVPFRPAGGHPRGKTAWHEGKVGVWARLGQHRTRPGQVVTRLAQRRLVAVLGGSEALKTRRWLEARRQGIMHAAQGGWRRDGARGLGRLFEERCTASARGGVDFYQAGQQLWKRAAAWLDGRTTQARRWCGWARPRLRQGNPDGGLADLAAAWAVEGLPDTARDTLGTV